MPVLDSEHCWCWPLRTWRCCNIKDHSYIYLGAIISNEKTGAQIQNHVKGKAPHLRKFISFLTKNSECPYNVKHKVWKSALNSAVLYSCETWISNDFKILDTPYLTTLKQMLGVRSTTCSDLIYIETGLPDVKSLIIDRQIKYLKCLRTAHVDDYIDKIIKMAIHHRTPMGRRLRYLETLHANVRTQCEMFLDTVSQRVLHSNTSRRQLYLLMNPSLEAHTSINSLKPSNPKTHIKEVHRISLTRMRSGLRQGVGPAHREKTERVSARKAFKQNNMSSYTVDYQEL